MQVVCCTCVASLRSHELYCRALPVHVPVVARDGHFHSHGVRAVLRATQLQPLELHNDNDESGGDELEVCSR